MKKMTNQAGVLSTKLKKILQKNIGELHAIKGNLLSVAKNEKIKTILVTSSKPAEGKTVTAVNMAYGLSETESKVMLIDGNLHKPCIHKMFNVNDTPGLSDFFTSNKEFNNDVLRETEYKRLSVMPCGTKMDNTFDVFNIDAFKEKLDSIKKNFDYVILDGHSIFSSSDVLLVAKHFDGIVMVVECEKTKWEVVQQAKEKLNNVGGNILGIVLNKRSYHIPEIFYS